MFEHLAPAARKASAGLGPRSGGCRQRAPDRTPEL